MFSTSPHTPQVPHLANQPHLAQFKILILLAHASEARARVPHFVPHLGQEAPSGITGERIGQ